MRVVNYSEARNSLKSVLDGVAHDHDITIINRRDGADAVVMSLDHYQSVMALSEAGLSKSMSKTKRKECAASISTGC